MRRIVLSSFLVLACGCAHTPEAQPAPQAAPAPLQAQVMQVVNLRYASAEELGKVLVQALGSSHRKSLRVVADPRTNSLVLMGETEADIATALELIAKLDVEATKAPEAGKVPGAPKAP